MGLGFLLSLFFLLSDEEIINRGAEQEQSGDDQPHDARPGVVLRKETVRNIGKGERREKI